MFGLIVSIFIIYIINLLQQSGGGTIAALAEAYDHSPIQNPTVLICHAGGESTRCPTQIALGKAWTSLPILYRHNPDRYGAIYSTKVSNPTSLLIDRLGMLFRDVPRGSVVVAASDVLLQFDSNGDEGITIDFSDIDEQNLHNSKVIGLAVPAPFATAKNHGVFVVDSKHDNHDKICEIHPTYDVLQKPSVEEMEEKIHSGCAFRQSKDAWIDTGVIAFLPEAADILVKLSMSTLKACTRKGLRKMHKDSQDTNEKEVSLKAFAKNAAPKVCLYSDILHSLRTTAKKTKLCYGNELMIALHKAFSEVNLYTCTISSGKFIHLGTTRELMDFLLNIHGEVKELTGRAKSSLSCFSGEYVAYMSVAINTRIHGNNSNNNEFGPNSIAEHCLIDEGLNSSLAFEIQDNCLVSGLRPNIKSSLRVPSSICLQLLALKAESTYAIPSKKSFICMCFGVQDDIKASPPTTLYGVEFNELLQSCGLNDSDLWDQDVEKKMIWNAKIMPILSEDDEMKLDFSFLEWIEFLKNYSSVGNLQSFRWWKESVRISISQIRQHIDPSAEILHRKAIMCDRSQFDHLKNQLRPITERKNEPCDFGCVIDFVSDASFRHSHIRDPFQHFVVRRILHELNLILRRSEQECKFDISGRCLMTMALLLSDIIKCHPDYCEIDSDISLGQVEGYLSKSRKGTSIENIISIKDAKVGPYNLECGNILKCCTFLEKAATIMMGRCVCGNGISPKNLLPIASPVSIGTSVVASAPARIDLSGGWSDTPPISYEHGGAVACIAVTVDEQRPLRAKCKFVSEWDGILLRTESRNLSNNELVTSSDVKIHHLKDLQGYNDPRAECSLLKCALILLGLVTTSEITADPTQSIQPYLHKFCQNSGLEVVSVSLLPTGSGMGGSSILGGCVLAAISRCKGVVLDNDNIVNAVLMLEQMMTTGGGWQDQIGGLFGGLKLGSSDVDTVLQTKVHSIDIPVPVHEQLDSRLALVFTGKPRLAKDILQNVLRRWARRSNGIVNTVEQLVRGAHDSVECLMRGDIDRLGTCISSYWEQKKIMAGPESGVEPDFVLRLLTLLRSKSCIVGGTLCGAGGKS